MSPWLLELGLFVLGFCYPRWRVAIWTAAIFIGLVLLGSLPGTRAWFGLNAVVFSIPVFAGVGLRQIINAALQSRQRARSQGS